GYCAGEVAENPVAICTLRDPRFPSLRCQRHRAVSRFLPRPGSVRVRINRVKEKKTAKDSESRPGDCEIWIKLDRFNISARGPLIEFVTVLSVLDRQTAKVSVVCRSVLRWPIGHGLLFGA